MSHEVAHKIFINKSEFLEDKMISTSREDERLISCIREAQQFDLKPLIGDEMFYDLLKNHDPDAVVKTKYEKLIAGESYINGHGYEVAFFGLRMALKYWAYARYINKQQVNVTSQSVVTKTNPFSQPTESKAIAIEVQDSRSGAISYWSDAVKYLDNKSSDFPLWKRTLSEPRRSIKVTSIGGASTNIQNLK